MTVNGSRVKIPTGKRSSNYLKLQFFLRDKMFSLFSRNSPFTKKQQGTYSLSIFIFLIIVYYVLIGVKEGIKRCKVCQKGSCENADLKCQVTMQSEYV